MQQIGTGKQHELELLVRRAGQHILELWPGKRGGSSHLKVDSKSDNSLVTNADYESNQILVDGLRRLFPESRIVSEEGPFEVQDLSRQPTWVIDPIDGTMYFLEGKDHFRILIGLLEQGEVNLGLMYFPTSDRLFYAQRARGCSVNGQLLKVSGQNIWDKASIFLNHLAVSDAGVAKVVSADTALACIDLCTQKLDAGVVRITEHKSWDLLPYIVMAQESGGVVTDQDGRLPRFESTIPAMSHLVFSNGLLHATVLDALKRWRLQN